MADKKQGELTTQQIVILVIIIVSFIVLLYFLLRTNPGETSSKQICHNSVVLLSKSAGLVGSLDCKTSYLCISGGSNCADFNPTDTINVDVSKEDEIKNNVMKILAEGISDCLWMFGEGKIDYASGLLQSSTHCAICSRIKFDSKLQESVKEISSSEIYNYMATHQSSHDASKTYLNYLYKVNKAEGLDIVSLILTNKEYLIVTGIDPSAPYIWGDKNLPVHILGTGEITTKTGCEIFDITKS